MEDYRIGIDKVSTLCRFDRLQTEIPPGSLPSIDFGRVNLGETFSQQRIRGKLQRCRERGILSVLQGEIFSSSWWTLIELINGFILKMVLGEETRETYHRRKDELPDQESKIPSASGEMSVVRF